MPMMISDSENAEFRQILLLCTNAVWLLLSVLWLDRSWPIKFSIIRMVYFFIFGICRTETSFTPDPCDNIEKAAEHYELPLVGTFSYDQYKSTKVFFTDLATWCFVVWAFGLSFLPDYGWAIF